MAQIIVYENENGGVSITYPTPEFLQTHTIQDVLDKDCPSHAIIIDESELPSDRTFFNTWVLNNGVVIEDPVKKQAIVDAQAAVVATRQSMLDKLDALGLTPDEITHLIG